MKQSTKEEVTQVLMNMLHETPLETLRIKDLLDRANISKSTFYRMFLDKYEAAIWIYKRIADDVVHNQPDLGKHGEWGDVLCGYMYEHKTLFRNICSYHGQNSFEEFLSEYFYGNSIRFRKHPETELTDDQKFAIHAYCFLAAHETNLWAENGFRTDYEILRRRLHLCIPDCVKEFF